LQVLAIWVGVGLDSQNRKMCGVGLPKTLVSNVATSCE
jgi:hypothetical protein